MSRHSISARAVLLIAALAAPLTAQERVTFRHLTIADGLSQNVVSAIVQDRRGFMWFGTKDGLNRYDGYQFVVFRHNPFDSTSISDSEITAVFEDSRGRLWVGSVPGLSMFDSTRAGVRHYYHRYRTYRYGWGEAVSLVEDRSGQLWLSTRSELMRFDPSTGSFASSSSRPQEFGNTGVWAVVEDPPGFLWAATYQGLYHYEIATGQYRHYWHDPADSAGLPEETTYDVFRDRDGVVWAATENFLVRLADAERGRFDAWRHKERPTTGQWIFPSIIQDARGALWLGSDQGLARFDPATGTFRRWRHDPRQPGSLSHDAVRSILADPRQPGRFLWIGTAGGGLNRFDIDSGTFAHFTERDGLPNDVVYGILADTSGALWVSTNKGLSRFDPATKRFRNYDANDGLQSNEFNSGAAFASRRGELFFGGIYGFNYFRPEAIHDNPNVPAVAITGFRRGNRYETVRDTGTVLTTTISQADTLRLSYRDAVLTFEFAALEYSAPAKNRYAYRLIGFNDEWFESGAVRAATYTNLPPGRYTLQVRASNNDGVWNQRGTSLALVILPPWWRTWWAYALYGAVVRNSRQSRSSMLIPPLHGCRTLESGSSGHRSRPPQMCLTIWSRPGRSMMTSRRCSSSTTTPKCAPT